MLLLVLTPCSMLGLAGLSLLGLLLASRRLLAPADLLLALEKAVHKVRVRQAKSAEDERAQAVAVIQIIVDAGHGRRHGTGGDVLLPGETAL